MGPNTNRCETRTPVRIRITSGYDLGIFDTHLKEEIMKTSRGYLKWSTFRSNGVAWRTLFK